MTRRRPPTDFKILKEIYRRHRDDFGGYEEAAARRVTKIFVPVDIPAVAETFKVDRDIIFGRLYYHLEEKYGQPVDAAGGPRKSFFTPVLGPDTGGQVNFPLLEAVLAGLWQEWRRDQLALWTAVLSLGLAIAALVVSIITA